MVSVAKDFHVTVRVKNGRIIRRMRELGIKTVADLSRISGADQQRIGLLLTFKNRPYNQFGEWKNLAFAISAALRCEPEDLWPEHIAGLKARRSQISFDADLDEVQNIAAQVEKTEFLDRANIPKLLACLNERQRRIVTERFGLNGGGEATLEELGKEHGIKQERVRQIEAKAIRTMRDKLSKQRASAALKALGAN